MNGSKAPTPREIVRTGDVEISQNRKKRPVDEASFSQEDDDTADVATSSVELQQLHSCAVERSDQEQGP